MVPCNACHNIWQDYQYGMINYQCMSHYGMVPMHITVWQDFINACMMYQCMHDVSMHMHVTVWHDV